MHDKCFIIISEYYIITAHQRNGKSHETQKNALLLKSLHFHCTYIATYINPYKRHKYFKFGTEKRYSPNFVLNNTFLKQYRVYRRHTLNSMMLLIYKNLSFNLPVVSEKIAKTRVKPNTGDVISNNAKKSS